MTAVAAVTGGPLLSAQWFRVATLRPRLDAQAQVLRRPVRGEVWRVVTTADGTRSVRLDALAWAAVGRCDGRLTLQRLWEAVLAEHGDDVPTQDELIALLVRLQAAGLMSFDRALDVGARPGGDEAPRDRRTPPGDTGRGWRWSLGCPDAGLGRLAGHLRGLFTPAVFVLWLAGVLAAAVAGWLHRDELLAAGATVAQSPRLLVLGAIVYPVVKALHELAHGLVLRHHGGRVAEWGLAWLMVMPAPYVDASSAALLAGRRARAAVSAAGLMVELGLAALALPVVLSTLLVNGNPLLRFDGYHLLCDLLDLPNLAPRSARWWLHGLRRRLLGVAGDGPIVPAPGERPWLWAYAPAALAMRWSVAAGVVLWLASLSMLLGAVALALFGWTLVGRPAVALARWLGGLALADADRRRALGRVLLLAGLVVTTTVAVPLPDATRVQGVVWRPDAALLRVPTAGFVEAVLVQDGEAVRAGQPLLRLRAPELPAELARLDGRIEAARAERFQALAPGQEVARAVAAEHALLAAQAERDDAARRLDQLVIRAPSDGHVRLVGAADLPGRHLARGTLLGHLDSGAPGLVRIAIAQAQAARVVGHAGPVEVRLAGVEGERVLTGRIVGSPSGGEARLPAAALGERGGGPFALDPADPDGLKLLQPVLLADVQLDVPVGDRIGARAHVRLLHGHAPLAWQLARALQQQVLAHGNPSQ
jgi:putative peptide zinc metalloprotease protein